MSDLDKANKFIHELYFRLNKLENKKKYDSFSDLLSQSDYPVEELEKNYIDFYKKILTIGKDQKVLDIGCGSGWFCYVSSRLGYNNIVGVDFDVQHFNNLKDIPDGVRFLNVKDSIINTISMQKEVGFCHISHLLEHIPKYDLIDFIDSVYQSMSIEGVLMIRVPNMDSIISSQNLYTTMGHEYGFIKSNLEQLLLIAGYRDITFIRPHSSGSVLGKMLRYLVLNIHRFVYRVFGSDKKTLFDTELICVAKKY